ncbi:MAG: hypothetical protein F2681_10220 [Actinobacteria bacterium]|uniref:Unannotated protein n=1 Tax=freshwater metagenome TaxID=449393 RepID=A0A6J7BSR7_9ZZZZ|nr:hypothetical protein [Actinomycetota bacterium]MSW78259.1 hypothetical protein [Actinomycetota bacterium]MSX54628.1 hypothetical protein [Actinomycetota bacterium]MSX94531.1 hypothetical protein [Actinomycetota bacterium]MSZ83505.1 hypothetical protein [Actinomycetota bacterium]
MSRSDRQGCDYDASLPDTLADRNLALPAYLVADLSDADAAIRRLNASGTSHVSLEGLARFLLRAESVASSKIEALDARWREQLGRIRANSATELLLDLLPGVPVITVESAARLIGRSEMRTGEAVNRLEAAGVLRQRNIGRQRYRIFEATGVVELFTGLGRYPDHTGFGPGEESPHSGSLSSALQ